MSKKDKNKAASAAEAAAAQAAPGAETTGKKASRVDVIQLGDLDKLAEQRAISGLDPNRTVDLLKMMHETYRMDPKAAEHIGIEQETVDKINRITAIGQVAVLVNEVSLAQTPFAISMRVSQLEALKEVAPLLNVAIDTKSLPAPKEDGTVELPSSAVKVSKEAEKAIKEEREATSRKIELDPTKVENEQQLKDTLLHILVKGNGNSNFYSKVITAINFYESYLSIIANKSENKDAELAALKEKKQADFLLDIANLLGKCSFTINGLAKFMYEQTERSKNPIIAFCTLRNASLNAKTGMPQIEDSIVAGIVKVLIRWYANTEIQTTKEVIEGFKRDMEVLEKDKKKNAKAIEQGTQKIAHAEKHIEDVETVVSYAYCPTADVIDNIISSYDQSNSEGYKMARMTVGKIMETYYPGVKAKEVEATCLMHNIEQYCGVIFNMFLPETAQLVNYAESNIAELKKKSSEEANGEKKTHKDQ